MKFTTSRNWRPSNGFALADAVALPLQKLRYSVAGMSIALMGMAMPAVSMAQVTTLPFGELTFVNPTGSVANNESIDVALRLTLDSASPALEFDPSSSPEHFFDAAIIPTQGYVYPPIGPRELRDYDSVTGVRLNVGAGCSGTFIGDCSPGVLDYTFSFNYGPGSVIGLSSVNVQPGGTLDFVLGSFAPTSGFATPGTYTFEFALLSLEFYGTDAGGEFVFADGLTLAQTCATCNFSRTVVAAVPEPENYAMLLSGLALIGAIARRRIRA